jgi:hypothetical protein
MYSHILSGRHVGSHFTKRFTSSSIFLKIYCYTKLHGATFIVGIDMDSCMVACHNTEFVSLIKNRHLVQPTGREHIYMKRYKAYLYLQIYKRKKK